MRKSFLALSLLVAIAPIGLVLNSCSNDNVQNEDNITGVEISGPIWVNVGSSITLKADVIGSDDDLVNWKVNDETIATIDNDGKLTGISEGEVEVTATSVAAPEFSGKYTVSIKGIQSEGIELVILSDDPDIKIENGIYRIPGGKEFKIGYKLTNESASKPTSVAYSFSFANGDSARSLHCDIELQEDQTAIVKFNSVFTGGVLTVAARYTSSINPELKHSISVESYDKNSDNDAKLEDIIENIKEKELSSLTSAHRKVITLNETSNSGVSEINENFEIYDGAVYSSKSTTIDDETTKENTYSTVDATNNAFYLFSYNNDKTIDTIYMNEVYDVSEKDIYLEYSKLPHFIGKELPSFGFGSLLNSMSFNDTYEGGDAFGNFDAKGNATYTFNSNNVVIKSEFINESQNTIDLSLEFNYSSSYELTDYEFVYSVKLNGETESKVYYQENGSNFVYGDKEIDTDKDIDISLYYIKSFNVEYIENYYPEDNSRYEYISHEVDSEGNDVYSLTYDHSLPLQIRQIVPNTGSTLIDVAKVVAKTTDTETKNYYIYEDGSIVISAPKNDDGDFFECTTTVEFETRGGGKDKVLINWIKPDLTGIKFSYSNSSQMPENTFTFPSIRAYQNTAYFWLNPIPDDSIYNFGMKVVEGDESGIKLTKYEDAANMDRAPRGSYAIDGIKVGTYTFYFYVEGYEEIKTQNYTITVLEPISVDEYKSNLIGNTYLYTTGTSKFELTFASETDMILKMPTYLADTTSGGSVTTVEEHISYKINEGQVTIDTDGVDKVNQIFESTDGYFESAYGGPIEISDDFTSVGIKLRIRSDAEGDKANNSYNVYTFTKVADLDGLAGKKVETQAFITDYGMSKFTLSFLDDTNAMLEVYSANNVFIGGFTFTYQYDKENNQFIASNVLLSDNCVEGFAYKDISLIYGTNNLRVSILIPNQYYVATVNADFDLSKAI